jgi:hypothetical protein
MTLIEHIKKLFEEIEHFQNALALIADMPGEPRSALLARKTIEASTARMQATLDECQKDREIEVAMKMEPIGEA